MQAAELLISDSSPTWLWAHQHTTVVHMTELMQLMQGKMVLCGGVTYDELQHLRETNMNMVDSAAS